MQADLGTDEHQAWLPHSLAARSHRFQLGRERSQTSEIPIESKHLCAVDTVRVIASGFHSDVQ
jgi:hypothetical protein